MKQRDKSDFLFKDLVVDRELLWETDEKHRLRLSCVKQPVPVTRQNGRHVELLFIFAAFSVMLYFMFLL